MAVRRGSSHFIWIAGGLWKQLRPLVEWAGAGGQSGLGADRDFQLQPLNGHLSEIANTPIDTSSETCVLNGIPSSLVINPAGTYAYAILTLNSACPGSVTGLQTFKINSDGNVPTMGSPVSFNPENVLILGTNTPVSPAPPVIPYFMVMDPTGKFLFVADRATSAPNPAAGSPQQTPDLYVPGAISVFAPEAAGYRRKWRARHFL